MVSVTEDDAGVLGPEGWKRLDPIDVARYIMDSISTNPGSAGCIPADQLALVLVLGRKRPRTISNLRDTLGFSQSATSYLVTRAEAAGRAKRIFVEPENNTRNPHRNPHRKKSRDSRQTLVDLAPRTIREMERTRAHRKGGA